MRGGSITGAGTMLFAKHPSFARYVGEWLDGAFDGRGQLFLKSGEQYCGAWVRGVRSGVGQHLYAPAAATSAYRGCWAADLFEGDGVLYFKNGQVLTAQFKNGLAEGLGVTLDKKGKVLNKGRFAAGSFLAEAPADEPKIKALQARCAKDFAPEAFPDIVLSAHQPEDSEPEAAARPKKGAAREPSSSKAGSKKHPPGEAEATAKVAIKAKPGGEGKPKEEPAGRVGRSKDGKSKDKKIKKVTVESNDD